MFNQKGYVGRRNGLENTPRGYVIHSEQVPVASHGDPVRDMF